jgi:hypothetical protein
MKPLEEPCSIYENGDEEWEKVQCMWGARQKSRSVRDVQHSVKLRIQK